MATIFAFSTGFLINSQSLLEYERAADAEWSLSVQGESSSAADEALWRAYEAYGKVETHTDFQKTLLSTSFANLDKVSQARSERILTAATDQGPPRRASPTLSA